MCEKCKELLNVATNKKAVSVLAKEDAFDADVCETIMELNHEDDGTPYAFIKTEVVIKSTGRSYGTPICINYCPFCGEQLIKNK